MKAYKLLSLFFAFCMFSIVTSCVKEPELGSIQGIVTNASNSEPIRGVNISLSPTGLSTVTGSDGRYEFTNLQPGNYTVQGVKTGYESNTKNITIVAGNVSSGDMTLKPEVSGFNLNVEYLDFGTNFSSLNFKIINTSNTLPLSWSITESMGWLTATPSSGNLNAGQEVVVMVTIDRDQIEQSTTTNLTVSAADQTVVLPVNVSVSGSNGPQLQLSETSLDFGTSATSLAFYVMNTGPVGTSLNWTCSNITVDWLMITPTSGNTAGGSSTAVMATIDRSKIDGMVSTSVTISGAGSSATISISAATEGAGAAILQLSEGSIDFGETEVTKTFLVKNVGSAGTVLDWSIAAPNVDWLTLTPMTGNTNAGSGTQVTAVIDRNKIHGMVSTTITVRGSNNSANLNVSATNLQPVLEVPVTSIDFGKIDTQKILQIKNAGEEGSVMNWTIANPTVDWLAVSPMSGSTNANATRTITLTLDRTKFDGDVSTLLTVTSGSQNATVTVTASTAQYVLEVTPSTIDFGTLSNTKTFTVKNTGETGSNMSWSIDPIGVEWLTGNPMSGSLSANQTTTVTLTLDRTKFNGNVSTVLQVNGGTQNASVTVTAATPVPSMTVTPSAVDFGTTSTTQSVTIGNNGQEGSVLSWSIDSPSVTWLTVTPSSGTVNANMNATVNLIIDRNAFMGVQNTNLYITGAGTTVTLPITVDNTVLAVDGLIAYYTFDDGTVNDWNGNYNGVNNGAATSTDTPSNQGYAMEFNGSTAYLQIPYPIFQSGTSWSYNVWFKTGSNNCALLGTNDGYAYISFTTASKLYVDAHSGFEGWTSTQALTSYINNQWHMLTIAYTPGNLSVYVDGSLFETTNASNSAWFSSYNLTYIGARKWGSAVNYFFNGKMDNIRTYNRALTQAEITNLFNAKQ